MNVLVVELQPLNFDRHAVAARVALPVRWIHGQVFTVAVPPGWTGGHLTSHLIQALGPYLVRINEAPQAAPMGGCNCIGRR